MSISELMHRPERARRLEVFTGVGRRRNWPTDEKAAIVAESYVLGKTVCGVARRHGLSPAQLFTWRRLARRSRLPVPEPPVRFVPAVVEAVPGLPPPPASQPRRARRPGRSRWTCRSRGGPAPMLGARPSPCTCWTRDRPRDRRPDRGGAGRRFKQVWGVSHVQGRALDPQRHTGADWLERCDPTWVQETEKSTETARAGEEEASQPRGERMCLIPPSVPGRRGGCQEISGSDWGAVARARPEERPDGRACEQDHV